MDVSDSRLCRRVCCVLHFVDVPPGIGLAASCPLDSDCPLQGDTSGSCARATTARPTNAGLSEIAKWGERVVASRQFDAVTPYASSMASGPQPARRERHGRRAAPAQTPSVHCGLGPLEENDSR